MIRVLVADDHPIVRKGLVQLLQDDKDERFGLIDEAGNGRELMEKISTSAYDVILLDISMPGRNGLDLIKDIRNIRPGIAILILSIYPEEQYALKAIRLGASGYLTKDAAPQRLIDAVYRVSCGGRYMSSSLAEKIVFGILDEKDSSADSLSPREMEVLRLMAAGLTLSGIARELSLSPKTISTYRLRLLEKLKLKTSSDLIRYAITSGLG